MNELRYQLDLMRAMNQKLSAKERMYRLLCDTMDYAYIYYSFEKNTVTTLGKWDDFFDFQILDRRDFVKLQEMVDEPYVLALREMLFLEKSGRETDSVECMQRGKKDLAAVFQQDFLRRWQADGSDYCGTEYHQTENTERRASLHGVLRQSDRTVQP